jgi:hypothetical protein
LLYSNKNISFFSGAALWTVQQKWQLPLQGIGRRLPSRPGWCQHSCLLTLLLLPGRPLQFSSTNYLPTSSHTYIKVSNKRAPSSKVSEQKWTSAIPILRHSWKSSLSEGEIKNSNIVLGRVRFHHVCRLLPDIKRNLFLILGLRLINVKTTNQKMTMIVGLVNLSP